jgi:hypothetical protein
MDTEKEIKKYVDFCTVGELLEFIEKNNIPKDSKILAQRVEDLYFEEHNWKPIRKEGEFFYQALDWKNKALSGEFSNKEEYPDMHDETIKKIIDVDLEEMKEQYTVIFQPIYYPDSKHLFLNSHY